MYPRTNIPKFSCVIPGGKRGSEKEKEFCANRASGHQRNCHFPFRFFLHVRGMVWITVRYGICPFQWLLKAQSELSPPPLLRPPAVSVHWILCCRWTTVRRRALGCDTQLCDNSLLLTVWVSWKCCGKTQWCDQCCKLKIHSLCACVYLPE